MDSSWFTTLLLFFIAAQLFYGFRLLQRRSAPEDENRVLARNYYLVERLELFEAGRDRLNTGTESVPYFGIQEPYRWHNPRLREWIGDTLCFNADNGDVLAERKFEVFRDYAPAKGRYDACVKAAPFRLIATEVWLKAVHMPSEAVASARMPELSLAAHTIESSGTIVHRDIAAPADG